MAMNNPTVIPFVHRQSAHCETGVLSNLLSHHGLAVSEPMVFGIGAGLFFGYFPFIRLNHLPLTAFRAETGKIMNRAGNRLGIKLHWETFKDPHRAMDALDEKIGQQIPVGCRTGAYWLTYFPRRYRFHFNMHNLVVYGKRGEDYLISDPVFPDPVTCTRKDLMKARFARGPMPPKGKMYYLDGIPKEVDFQVAVKKGIAEVCRAMLKVPVPFMGVRGIRYLAKKLALWPEKLGERKAALYLGQIIRMQEEIGTGGAGFRFIYAAFLQEAAQSLGMERLLEMSERMTRVGDHWRRFALMASRNCKKRASDEETYPAMADVLKTCADGEEALFRELAREVR